MEYEILFYEKRERKSGGPVTICYIKCTNPECSNVVKYKKSELSNWSGFCKTCNNRKRPFESLYHTFVNSNNANRKGKIKVLISYEEFLTLTEIKTCHYCNSIIPWTPYPTVNGKFIRSSHFLDRKDSDKDYTLDNIVVCCTRCNRGKSNTFSYEEWYGMTEYLRNKNGRI